MIRQSLERYLTSKPSRRLDGMLWASDLGGHPAKAMRRVLYGEQTEFDVDTLIKMQSGNALEADTEQAIRFAHAGVLTQFPVFNEMWTGYVDLVFGHGTEDVTLVEHKATGDKWFDYKQSLPRSSHVCQLWLYGQLYREMYGIQPKLILFYRAWGNWAELEIEHSDNPELVRAHGLVDGQYTERLVYIAPAALREELEDCYRAGAEPVLFESEESWTYPEDSYPRLVNRQDA